MNLLIFSILCILILAAAVFEPELIKLEHRIGLYIKAVCTVLKWYIKAFFKALKMEG